MEPQPQDNPYQSPTSDEEPDAINAALVEVDRRRVVCPPVATLPKRCVYCNEPGTSQKHVKSLFWLCWNGLVTIRVNYFVCESHRRQLVKSRAYSLLSVGTIALVCASLEADLWSVPDYLHDNYELYVFSCLILGVANFLWRRTRKRIKPQTLRIVRGNHREVHVANAGKPFLESLTSGGEGFRAE